MTSKQVTSPPWNRRKLVHSKEMVWAWHWSVALRTFYRQILSLLYSSFFFWNFRPRLARELLVSMFRLKSFKKSEADQKDIWPAQDFHCLAWSSVDGLQNLGQSGYTIRKGSRQYGYTICKGSKTVRSTCETLNVKCANTTGIVDEFPPHLFECRNLKLTKMFVNAWQSLLWDRRHPVFLCVLQCFLQFFCTSWQEWWAPHGF